MFTFTTDISLLNERMGNYARALQLEPRDVVRMQAGILLRELSEGAAPKSRESLERSIEKDVRKVYARPLPFMNMISMQHREGKGFVWVMSSHKRLIGVASEDYRMGDSVEDLQRQFHHMPYRDEKYKYLGKRGRQKVVQLNRVLVKERVFNQFIARLKKRAGLLGGAWAVSWNVLQPKGAKPPAYKFRHVGDGSAKGTYIDGLGIPGHAQFSLVNRAVGCEHPRQIEMVREKLRYRAEAMQKDMRNLLRGAYKRAGFKAAQ